MHKISTCYYCFKTNDENICYNVTLFRCDTLDSAFVGVHWCKHFELYLIKCTFWCSVNTHYLNHIHVYIWYQYAYHEIILDR